MRILHKEVEIRSRGKDNKTDWKCEDNEELGESAAAIRISILQVIVSLFLILSLFCIGILIFNGRAMALKTLVYTVPVILMYWIFAVRNMDLFRDSQGIPKTDFRTANILTAVRIILVPPVLLFLLNGYFLTGMVLFCVGAVTDILDGLVARWMNQETRFGLLTDPLGDIASTFTVFSYFIIEGYIPIWLYILLTVRYLEFFIGYFLLYRRRKHLKVEATIAGKVVGVIQSVGIVIIIGEKIFAPSSLAGQINHYLFPLLGTGFGAVIISQTFIGWKKLAGTEDGS